MIVGNAVDVSVAVAVDVACNTSEINPRGLLATINNEMMSAAPIIPVIQVVRLFPGFKRLRIILLGAVVGA